MRPPLIEKPYVSYAWGLKPALPEQHRGSATTNVRGYLQSGGTLTTVPTSPATIVPTSPATIVPTSPATIAVTLVAASAQREQQTCARAFHSTIDTKLAPRVRDLVPSCMQHVRQ